MLSNGSLWNESYENGNSSTEDLSNDSSDFIDQDGFEQLYVRVSLILAYSIVFFCCFFGNLLVIVVVMIHRRMRTATNFFLANLALADFCVGIFCVYQNLLIYLTNTWALGEFLCRMYHFIQGLSYTASILILTIISMERYVVIVHPMWGRRYLTLRRLRIALGILWLISAIYNCPRLIFFGTITINEAPLINLCINQRRLYNSEQFEIYNFAFLFVFPLIVMGVLYTRIGLKLWRSERLHGEKNKDCFCCLYKRKRRRKFPRPLLRIIETPSVQSSITQESTKDPSPLVSTPDTKLAVSDMVPECNSSCEEDDEKVKMTSSGSTKSVNTLKGSSFRQSSFRSGSSRRLNGSIKFAQFDSENRLTSNVPSHVLNSLHHSSLKSITREKSNPPVNSINQDSICEDVLLLNQVNQKTNNIEKISNDSDVQTILLTEEPRKVPSTFSESLRGNIKRILIRSVSQHSHQTDGARTSIEGSSIRSYDKERSDYIESVSQQNGESSGAPTKKGKGKLARKGSKVLRSRRKIIRLLIAVLCTFAACNLPNHARRFWQSWSPSYNGSSTTTAFITISTTLILYMNSGINPFLYAFLSANFRKSIKDVVMCRRHLWSTHVFSPNASNNSRLTTSSSGPVSQGSMSSAVSNF